MPIVGLIDAGVVAFRLQASGWGERSGRGSIRSADGICSTFDRVPSVLIQSVVVSLVPLVAAAKQKKMFLC